MADITIGGLPLQTVANDTDITHIQNGGTDKRISIESISKNLPIGYIYTQYPNKDSPSDLGLVGTWTNVSSTFAGNFFRAEGGAASTFESGTQSDQIQQHGHTFVAVTNTGATSGTFPILGSATGQNIASGLTLTSSVLDAVSVGSGGTLNAGIETRAINETIRIWERTA